MNIVPAEIAVNVLIGCLYTGMRDYIYIIYFYKVIFLRTGTDRKVSFVL